MGSINNEDRDVHLKPVSLSAGTNGEENPIGTGEVRASEKDNMWLSQLGVESAAESLRLAYMGQNPGMQAREVGNAADSKIAELYAEAAKNTKYEAERLDYVEQQAKRLASDIREISLRTVDIFPPYTPCTDLRYTRREVNKMNGLTPAEAAKAAIALLSDATRDCETGYPDEHYRNAILELETHLDDNA